VAAPEEHLLRNHHLAAQGGGPLSRAPEEFKVQEEVKLRMIVLKCSGEGEAAQTGTLMEDILTKLKEGLHLARWPLFIPRIAAHEGGDLGWWNCPA